MAVEACGGSRGMWWQHVRSNLPVMPQLAAPQSIESQSLTPKLTCSNLQPGSRRSRSPHDIRMVSPAHRPPSITTTHSHTPSILSEATSVPPPFRSLPFSCTVVLPIFRLEPETVFRVLVCAFVRLNLSLCDFKLYVRVLRRITWTSEY